MKTFNQHIGRIIAPLFIKKFSESGVLVNVPDQKSNLITDKPTIGVLDWSFFTDVLLGYDLGFAESYLKGKWNTLNLTSLFTHLNNNNIKNSQIVMDVVMPPKTKLINLANRYQKISVDGLKLALYQAFVQFKLYTGRNPPIQVMEKTAKILYKVK